MKLSTTLTEAINGWILTVFGENGREDFIYERLVEAQQHRARVEYVYECERLQEVQKNASHC